MASNIHEPSVRFDFLVNVMDISKRTEKVGSRRSGPNQQDVEFIERDIGWYVRVSDHLSVYVGKEKPDIKPGDELYLILFKPEADQHLLRFSKPKGDKNGEE